LAISRRPRSVDADGRPLNGSENPISDVTYVELVNGEIVTRNAEEWRHECEARYLLRIKPRSDAVAELAELEKRRGKVATDRLRVTMNLIVQKDRHVKKA